MLLTAFPPPFEMQLVIPAALKSQSPTRGLDGRHTPGTRSSVERLVRCLESLRERVVPFLPRPHYDTDGKENESQRSHLEVRHCVL
ncbi:hypothetical protein CEXT_807081 [Caerostris extrusa]|uniref:Uncharacterized protein n=1 Tax=Caerostris extrusa TaxID=172846 RepID=A0AAV4P2E3_CAEEX|nr:hypothetical protein CEXT_807081 [Caerostris extrusa]